MKKEKNGLKKKDTLYATLVKQFIEAGYEVKEDSWVENVGHEKPVTEHWFDVVYKTEGGLKYTLHYWFGENLDKLSYVECWTHEEITVEVNHKKLF